LASKRWGIQADNANAKTGEEMEVKNEKHALVRFRAVTSAG
jgi:hypothetical protein